MKKSAIFFVFVSVVFWSCIYANGGPVDDLYDIKYGNQTFKNVKNIQLISEKMDVEIIGDFVKFDVEYLLENRGNSINVKYGFPIDFAGMWNITPRSIDLSHVMPTFMITDNGVEAPCESKLQRTNPEKEGEADWTTWKLWKRTTLEFKEKETKTLHIAYTIKSNNHDMVYTKSFKPRISARTINYPFKGASYWGDGSTQSISIHVDTKKLVESGGAITAIKPDGFILEKNEYDYKYVSVAVKDVPDLSITYENEKEAFLNYVKPIMVPVKAIKSIKASSTLMSGLSGAKQYEAGNMIDGNSATAWVEGKDDTGEGVEIELEIENYNLAAVGILNGYLKDENTYKENGKIESMDINLDGKEISYGKEGVINRQFKDFDPKNPLLFVDWIFDFGDGDHEVTDSKTRVVKLTITGAKSGTKYSDIAISELYLLGYPKKSNEDK